MTIDLGYEARLAVTECSDGWNIEIINPKDVRIGIANKDGIRFKYVTQVMADAEKVQTHIAGEAG
jgi:hypothetical protein